MSDLDNALTAWVTLFAAVMFVTAAISWWRLRSGRLLLATSAFGLFLAKGVLLTLALIDPRVARLMTPTVGLLLDTVVLALLALTLLRR